MTDYVPNEEEKKIIKEIGLMTKKQLGANLSDTRVKLAFEIFELVSLNQWLPNRVPRFREVVVARYNVFSVHPNGKDLFSIHGPWVKSLHCPELPLAQCPCEDCSHARAVIQTLERSAKGLISQDPLRIACEYIGTMAR